MILRKCSISDIFIVNWHMKLGKESISNFYNNFFIWDNEIWFHPKEIIPSKNTQSSNKYIYYLHCQIPLKYIYSSYEDNRSIWEKYCKKTTDHHNKVLMSFIEYGIAVVLHTFRVIGFRLLIHPVYSEPFRLQFLNPWNLCST